MTSKEGQHHTYYVHDMMQVSKEKLRTPIGVDTFNRKMKTNIQTKPEKHLIQTQKARIALYKKVDCSEYRFP